MKTSLIKSTFAVAAAFAAGSVLASRVETTISTNDVYGATFESSPSDVAPLNDFAYADGASITNYNDTVAGWFAGEGDASVIEANAGVTGAALKLSTEGQTLENRFSTADATAINTAVAGAGAVFEAQVKFVASDTVTDPFEGGTDANKFAIYAYAADENSPTNLVVYHKYLDDENNEAFTNEQFTVAGFSTELFTDVKVEVKGTGGNTLAFKVSINGTDLVSALPYAEIETDEEEGTDEKVYPYGDTWMMTANASQSTDLSALCFKGTGYVDDIAVSTLTETSTTYYTATFDDANGGIGYQEVVDGGTVTTNALADTVDYTFVEWTVGGSAATFPYEMHADTTFLATWTPKSSGGESASDDAGNSFSVPATDASAIATYVGGGKTAAEALAADTGRGTTYGQAYALGLLTFDGTGAVTAVADLPAATITFNADGEPVVTFENGMNPNTTDYVINYTLLKKTSLTGGWSGATTAAGPTTDPAALVDDDPGTAGFYKIKISITDKSVVE